MIKPQGNRECCFQINEYKAKEHENMTRTQHKTMQTPTSVLLCMQRLQEYQDGASRGGTWMRVAFKSVDSIKQIALPNIGGQSRIY